MRTFSFTPLISSSSLQDEASPRPATATAGNGPIPQNTRDDPPFIGPPLREKNYSFRLASIFRSRNRENNSTERDFRALESSESMESRFSQVIKAGEHTSFLFCSQTMSDVLH